MRAVIQRVSHARVRVEKQTVGEIDLGILVLLGVHQDDVEKDITWLADKVVNLRIFDDDKGRMNLSLVDISGEMLVVSQFTLLGDCRKGRRPSWSHAAPPDKANRYYEKFIETVRRLGLGVETGKFQAKMDVSLTNSGPVTLILDSHKGTLRNFTAGI